MTNKNNANSTPSKRRAEGVYTTHENENLLFVRAKVNGQLCAAYVKNGKLVSYEPLAELLAQMYIEPVLEFTTQ